MRDGQEPRPGYDPDGQELGKGFDRPKSRWKRAGEILLLGIIGLVMLAAKFFEPPPLPVAAMNAYVEHHCPKPTGVRPPDASAWRVCPY